MTGIVDFADWLQGELDQRGWRQSDLAKAAGLGTGTVSRIMNKERAPGPEACSDIARALNYPPDLVFRKAGLLPEGGVDYDTRELVHLFDQLSDEDQQSFLIMMRAVVREKVAHHGLSEASTSEA